MPDPEITAFFTKYQESKKFLSFRVCNGCPMPPDARNNCH